MQTASKISAERVRAAQRGRYNPIAQLTPATLTSWINSWQLGYLGELARAFEAIEQRDDTIAAVASKRYKAAARHGYEVIVQAADAERSEAAEHKAALDFFWNQVAVSNAVDSAERGGFGLLVRQMMRAVGHRYAVHEIVWRPADPRWVSGRNGDAPRLEAGLSAAFRFVPLTFFEATTGKLRFLEEQNSVAGVEMAEADWLVTVGDGLLLPSAICYLYKRLALTDWLSYNEDFGKPMIDAATDAARGSGDWDELRNMLADVSGAVSWVRNRSAEVKLIEARGGTRATFEPLIKRMDDGLIRLWRGGELSTRAAEGAAVGATAQQSELDVLETDDAVMISETLQQQVDRHVIEYYFGRGTKPLAYVQLKRPVQRNIDLDLKVDSMLAGLGVRLSASEAAERYGRTMAAEDEPVLMAAAPAAAGPGAEGVFDPETDVVVKRRLYLERLREQGLLGAGPAAGIELEEQNRVASANKAEAEGRFVTLAGGRVIFIPAEDELTPAKTAKFEGTAKSVRGAMSTGARARVETNLGEVKFYGSIGALSKARDEFRREPGGKVAGFVTTDESGKMVVNLDGGSGETTAREIYAHEFGHVIDGPGRALSSSREWAEAWKADGIGGRRIGKLSAQAARSPSEGFAEFSRLLLTGDRDLAEVEAQLPRATAFWRERGLI